MKAIELASGPAFVFYTCANVRSFVDAHGAFDIAAEDGFALGMFPAWILGCSRRGLLHLFPFSLEDIDA